MEKKKFQAKSKSTQNFVANIKKNYFSAENYKVFIESKLFQL